MHKIRPEIAELAVPIDDVHPHPRNPRLGDVKRLSESLVEHGQYVPIVVRKATGDILRGNHTWKAAVRLEWDAIAVAWADVDEEEALRILAGDNRYGQLGGFDEHGLADILRELAASEAGLVGTGYTVDELADLLDGLDVDVDAAALNDPDAMPATAAARTKIGDVWLLGPHRLICGSATDPADYEALLGAEIADALWTDPPYGVSYEGRTAERLTIENDDLAGDELYELLVQAFTEGAAHLVPGGAVYVTYSEAAGAVFRRAFVDAGLLLKQQLVWIKNAFVLGRQDYQWQHEPILYGWRPGAAHRWYGGRTRATVLDDQVPLGSLRKAELVAMLEEIRALSAAMRETRPSASRQHPTMKPVRLVARHLSNSTQPGDVVLDPFGGSGTTIIACHHTGRVGRMIERDAGYVDRICRRWQDHTGEEPVLEETGEPHDFGEPDG